MTSKPSLTNCPIAFAALGFNTVEAKRTEEKSYFQVLVGIQPIACLWIYVITHNQVVIAAGSHLFPFRTEKLSPLAPMVLQCNAGE